MARARRNRGRRNRRPAVRLSKSYLDALVERATTNCYTEVEQYGEDRRPGGLSSALRIEPCIFDFHGSVWHDPGDRHKRRCRHRARRVDPPAWHRNGRSAARSTPEIVGDIGVFVAPPGVAKTVVGTYLVAARARNTLVLVHRQPLPDQWSAQLSMFLGVNGSVGGGFLTRARDAAPNYRTLWRSPSTALLVYRVLTTRHILTTSWDLRLHLVTQ